MRYFAHYEDGKLTCLGIGDCADTDLITKEQYEALLAEINAKTNYMEKVYAGEMVVKDIPSKYREDVKNMVEGNLERFKDKYDLSHLADAFESAKDFLEKLK